MNTTIETLNKVQAEWMALQSTDPKPKQERVFKRMKDHMPKSHLSVSEDGSMASLTIDGSPMWANALPLREAIRLARDRWKVQTQFAWKNDHWIELTGPEGRIA